MTHKEGTTPENIKVQELSWQWPLLRITGKHRVHEGLADLHALWELWTPPLCGLKLTHETKHVLSALGLQQPGTSAEFM